MQRFHTGISIQHDLHSVSSGHILAQSPVFVIVEVDQIHFCLAAHVGKQPRSPIGIPAGSRRRNYGPLSKVIAKAEIRIDARGLVFRPSLRPSELARKNGFNLPRQATAFQLTGKMMRAK
jgi:hypothetical protein